MCSVHTWHGVFNRLLWIGGLRWWKNINLDVDNEGGLLSRVRLDVRLISWWLGLADLPILSLFNRRQTPHSFDLEFGRIFCKWESRRFLMELNFNSYSVIAINTMLLEVSVTAILTPIKMLNNLLKNKILKFSTKIRFAEFNQKPKLRVFESLWKSVKKPTNTPC